MNNKKDLARRLSDTETNMTIVDAQRIIDKLFAMITASLSARQQIVIKNFGIFEVRLRKERDTVSPQYPHERVKTPAMYVAKFRAAEKLKAIIRKVNR